MPLLCEICVYAGRFWAILLEKKRIKKFRFFMPLFFYLVLYFFFFEIAFNLSKFWT